MSGNTGEIPIGNLSHYSDVGVRSDDLRRILFQRLLGEKKGNHDDGKTINNNRNLILFGDTRLRVDSEVKSFLCVVISCMLLMRQIDMTCIFCLYRKVPPDLTVSCGSIYSDILRRICIGIKRHDHDLELH